MRYGWCGYIVAGVGVDGSRMVVGVYMLVLVLLAYDVGLSLVVIVVVWSCQISIGC